MRAFFIHTARDLDDSTQWYNRGPDYASGYGLLQIGDAVEQMQSGFFIENAIHDAQQKEYWMEILPDAADVKISLTWDDPPAVENASKALVNDLDIVVYDPKGKRYFPWTLNSSDPSAAAVRTREDDVNNVEQIFIESEALYPGIWQVLVKGTHVPEGPQIFSVTSSVKMYH